MVYPYKRDLTSNKVVDINERPNEPCNDLFGFENWRHKVWGSPSLKNLGCEKLISLRSQDIYAEGEDLLVLQREIESIKDNIDRLSKELNVRTESFEFRLANVLEAIRIALKFPNGGVCIG